MGDTVTVKGTSRASATQHIPAPAVAELRTHCRDVSQRDVAVIGRQPTSPETDILDKFESSRKSAIVISRRHVIASRTTYSDGNDIKHGHNHDRPADEALRAPEHRSRLSYNVWVSPEPSHVMISRTKMHQVTDGDKWFRTCSPVVH